MQFSAPISQTVGNITLRYDALNCMTVAANDHGAYPVLLQLPCEPADGLGRFDRFNRRTFELENIADFHWTAPTESAWRTFGLV